MARIFVRPNPGHLVRDERGRVLPEAGRWVIRSTHWARRIKAGDVQVLDNPPATSPASE